MGMGVGVSFQCPMSMGMGMGVIFKNGYGCGHTATRSKPAPLSFLDEHDTVALGEECSAVALTSFLLS